MVQCHGIFTEMEDEIASDLRLSIEFISNRRYGIDTHVSAHNCGKQLFVGTVDSNGGRARRNERGRK